MNEKLKALMKKNKDQVDRELALSMKIQKSFNPKEQDKKDMDFLESQPLHNKDIGSGMHRANKKTIEFLKNEIKKLYTKDTVPNTSRQIFEDGQKRGYYKLLRKLEAKNETIAENNKNAGSDHPGVMVAEAMEVIDDYLNAGYKDQRRGASEKAKVLYRKYYGKEYKNRVDR